MKQVNIMIGRFQPLTNGHLACIESAWRKFRIPTIICLIDVKDEKVDEKHPFPSSLLLPLYKSIFEKDMMVEDVVLVKNADIVVLGTKLKEMGYQIKSWTCGSDRYEQYKKMAEKYRDQAQLADDYTTIEVKRSNEDISATKVRDALLKDDYKTFQMMTPLDSLRARMNGVKVYDILKEQINKVYNES